jgi:PAS domain S-box-containing protein
MQTKKPKTGLAWWVAALINLGLVLLAGATLYMSDILLTRSAGWSQILSFLKTDRSWEFVGVLALLLYGLIGSLLARGYALPQADKLSDAVRTESISPVPSLWQGIRTPLLIFLLLSSAIGAMGYPICAYQRYALEKAAATELSAITDKKVMAIRHWLAERRSNAEFIARDSLIGQTFGRWLSAPTPAEEDSRFLETWLANLRESFDYSAVMILDTNGQVRLGLGASNIHPYQQALAQQAMASGQVILSDFHWRQEVVGGPIDLDLITPLGRGLAGGKQAIGALVLTIDPEQYLFPLIQIWPTASSSAETLLVRREGDEVVYLNELRHRQDTALQLRLPLASKELPAARALRGESEVLEGLDYRQVPVLSVGRPISETPWFLIAKIDTEEVDAPLQTLTQLMAIMASLLIMAAGVGTTLWWRQQHARFVAESYRHELEHQALVRHFDYLAKYANDIILLMDSGGQLIEVNDRAVAAYGYTSEELLRLNIRDLRPPESHALIAERISEAARPDGLIFETVHQRKDGTCFPVEVSSRRIDIDGQPFLQSIIRDITERKQTEEALAENTRFINQVLDTSPNLIWVKDAQGRFLLANRAVAELTGKTKEELVHQPCLEVFPNPEEVSEYLRVDREVIRTSQVIAQEESCTKPNGEVMWVYTTKAPVRQTDGTVSVLGIAVDITKRKQAEEALRESAAQLAWAQRLAHLGSWQIDLTSRREYWSDETYRILGYEPHAFEPLPDCLLSHVHPDDREHVSSAVARALKREGPHDITFRILRPSGEERVLHAQGEVVFDENGQAVVIKGAVQDITERRHVERQLREQEQQLIQADKLAALGTLVSGIAHEINNPNNLILLNAELLVKVCADLVIVLDHCQGETQDWLLAGLPYAEMRETLPTLIQDIHEGALRIQKTVADLKDFVRPSAITSGTEFSLNETIQHALKLLSHAIKKSTDHLQVDLAQDLPPMHGNAQQLEQVVVNLIMNALEALPDKTHGLSLATHLKHEDNCIELRVADEGIGIAPENLNRICEPFFTTKQHQQGTGLGLFIAYKLVTANQGTLSFQSEPGRGTVALVRLPLPAKLPAR